MKEITDHLRNGPMVEKDWDYVFQANKILNCSLVDPHTRQVSRASHAGIRRNRHIRRALLISQ